MKIICIEGNYCNKKKDLAILKEPVFFLKPESSVLRNNLPFFIPDHSKKIIPRINIVLKICRLGKNIQEKFAHLYYNEISLGVDMEATDVLGNCKKLGLPWEAAKSFDCSSPLGNFISIKEFNNLSAISFSININNNCICKSSTSQMLFSFDKIISYISKYVTLKTGDYIFTGSPEINYTTKLNDHIECFIENKVMLAFNVK